MKIVTMDAEAAGRVLPGLIALMRDAVDDGASVGFLPPLGEDETREYWEGVIDDIAAGRRALIAATEGDAMIGCAQLEPAGRANGAHRAEAQKLMVHTSARRRGVGRALMLALEAEARAMGRTLLVLDTREGDPSETLYARCGYTRVGAIPRYARSASGTLDGTVYYYKHLDGAKDGGGLRTED